MTFDWLHGTGLIAPPAGFEPRSCRRFADGGERVVGSKTGEGTVRARRGRTRAVLVLVTVLAVSAGASAGARDMSCVVRTDAAGDNFPAAQGVPAEDPSLDLRSVTFSAQNQVLHITLRIGAEGSSGSRSWNVHFTDGESWYSVTALETVGGNGFYTSGPGAAPTSRLAAASSGRSTSPPAGSQCRSP